MDKFNKNLHKTLNFFANNSLKKINSLRKNKSPEFQRNVTEYTEEFAFEEGYLDADERRKFGITSKGLEQLRILEGIVYNQKTFWLSITALIISLITFWISLYFRGGSN